MQNSTEKFKNFFFRFLYIFHVTVLNPSLHTFAIVLIKDLVWLTGQKPCTVILATRRPSGTKFYLSKAKLLVKL